MNEEINNIIALNNHLKERGDYLVAYYRENGQQAVILKGQALRPFYPEPFERPCGDIDIWLVPEKGVSLSEHRKKVLADLKEAGVEHGPVVYHHTDAHFFKDAEVELHFTPSWMYNPVMNYRLQKWFNEQGEQLDYRIYLTVHMFRHLYSTGITEKQREDLQRVVAQKGTPDFNTLRRLGLERFYRAIMDAQTPLESLRPWHFPREWMWRFPWRCVHYLWRRWNNFL